MDTFNSNSQGSWASNAKLTNVTKKQIRRKLLQRSNCASKPVPAKAERWDSHGQSVGIRPSTRNLCLFPSNRTHWVAYNQGSPFLADAPKDRKGWADTSNPRFALRLNWAEWEVKAQAFTQQLTQEAGLRPPPYSIHRCAPLINQAQKMQKLTPKIQKMKFWRRKPLIFCVLLCRGCKMIEIEPPKPTI